MLASKRLQPIVELAEQQESKAAQKMGQSQSVLCNYEKQLESLITMRGDYAKEFQRSGVQLSASRMLEFRRFMDKLDMAISQQHRTIQSARQTVLQHKHQWQKQHVRTVSLQKITDKRREQEQKQADKREQQQMDEHAQQLFARRLASGI